MDLSIVIINWNTCHLLARCLESVYANPPDNKFEVIIVDNGSADDSVAMIRERFPQVRLFANEKNVGFVRANNQAFQECQGRYVVLLNSDTIVQPNALAEMIKFLDENPQAGIVGAFVQNPDGTPQRCFGNFPTILTELAYAWGLDSWKPISKRLDPPPRFTSNVLQTDWVLGAALMIRRDILTQVGYLDETFFMYSEEVDLCYRVKQQGWANYVLRTATIVHLGGQSSQQIPAPMKAELFRSKIKYFRKHYGLLVSVLMYLIFAASILVRQFVYRLRGRKQLADIWVEAWKYFIHQDPTRFVQA